MRPHAALDAGKRPPAEPPGRGLAGSKRAAPRPWSGEAESRRARPAQRARSRISRARGCGRCAQHGRHLPGESPRITLKGGKGVQRYLVPAEGAPSRTLPVDSVHRREHGRCWNAGDPPWIRRTGSPQVGNNFRFGVVICACHRRNPRVNRRIQPLHVRLSGDELPLLRGEAEAALD